MADTLDQDVQALKEWLAVAWRLLADPSSTRFERQELRNYMKEADAALRAGAAKNRGERNGSQGSVWQLFLCRVAKLPRFEH